MYAIKHYILFATLTKQKYDLRKIKGFYNKLLIIILWIPGKMKKKKELLNILKMLKLNVKIKSTCGVMEDKENVKKNTMKKIIFIMIIIMFNSFQISNVNATDAKNNNPMLKAIKINGIDIEPTFDMLTTEYVVNVDNSVEKSCN